MTDEEVICEFMEPKPVGEAPLSCTYRGDLLSDGGFWQADEYTTVWHRSELTLDRLHEVEARLTDEQARQYHQLLNESPDWEIHNYLWHAKAEQKIAALAAVLRAARREGADAD